jgi:hypothetical protein
MDFVQPGGVTLAAVALPKSTYPNSDLASAFFNVSMNKTLTADQCGEFSVPQSTPADPVTQATTQPATSADSKLADSRPGDSKLAVSKLMIGDLELQSTETLASKGTSDGTREEASKYFHVFQNGACYEFSLKVATTAPATATKTESATKPIDRDEVFQRLEKILATVKIKNPVAAPEVNAEVKANMQPTPATPETPAQ